MKRIPGKDKKYDYFDDEEMRQMGECVANLNHCVLLIDKHYLSELLPFETEDSLLIIKASIERLINITNERMGWETESRKTHVDKNP